MNAAELTDSLAEAWDALLHTPLFGIALTLAVAVLSRRLWLAARQTALVLEAAGGPPASVIAKVAEATGLRADRGRRFPARRKSRSNCRPGRGRR